MGLSKTEVALLKKLLAKADKGTPTADSLKAKAIKQGLNWYEKKLGLKCVRQGFQVVLPTAKGNKTYDAFEFSNGKVAVYAKGRIKYAWN